MSIPYPQGPVPPPLSPCGNVGGSSSPLVFNSPRPSPPPRVGQPPLIPMGCGAPPPPPASRFCKDESLQPLGFDQCLSGLTDCYVTLRTTAGLSLLASNGNAGFFGSMWSIYRCALAVGSCSNLISSPTVSCYSTSVDIARGILPSGSGSLTCSPLMLCNETPVIAPCILTKL